ncbi:MAG: YlzJ-like family protein [Syntrophomonadaceae bacterium]|nr:YlzJ-like family protein [Syntrophomonadaceae bacterium]
MIYFHPDPMGLLTPEPMEAEAAPVYLQLPSGAVVSAVRQEGLGLVIQSVASTDPGDYLYPQLQPGQVIRLRPQL